MPMERIDKKKPFEQFKDKLISYTGREHPMGDNLVFLLKYGADPNDTLDVRYEPSDLSATDKKDDIKVRLYIKKCERYEQKKDELITHTSSLYDVLWGQCSPQLQSTIKYNEQFETKDEERDIVWLMKELQRETAGIDNLGNKHVNLIKAMKYSTPNFSIAHN